MAFGKGFMLLLEKGMIFNHSGEYALVAILNDRKEHTDEEDKQTLEQICRKFEEIRGKNPKVCYCFPSVIIDVAKEQKLEIKLYNLNLPILAEEEVMKEENAVKSKVGTGKGTIADLLGDSKNIYFLLLVRSGKWIVVKRKSDGKRFDIYDPLKDGKEKFDFQAALEAELKSSYDVNDETLVITVA